MPTTKMWEKIRKKYHGAMRLVCTWNPNKGTGSQIEWPWKQTDPPLWSVKWTVIGAKAWYEFDVEKDGLDKRNFASQFKKQKKPRQGNKKSTVNPAQL